MKNQFPRFIRFRNALCLGALVALSAPAVRAQDLTDLQKRANRFQTMITSSRANFFRGNALNFSSFNLSLVMDIMFSPPLTAKSPFVFNLATNGNMYGMNPEAVVFPLSGSVVFEVRGKDGVLKTFVGPDDEELTFPLEDRAFYLVESRSSFAARVKRQAVLVEHLKNSFYEQPIGPILAVVAGGINQLDVQFFQLAPDERTLVPSGVYSGKSIRP